MTKVKKQLQKYMLRKLQVPSEFFGSLKIRTQLLLLILAAGIFCFSLYHFLWLHKWQVYYMLQESPVISHHILPSPPDDFWIELRTEALKYNIPRSEDDTEGIKAAAPLFCVADEYTGISIYGLEDSLYRTGVHPSFYSSDAAPSFNFLYQWTDCHGENWYEMPIKFHNGYAMVLVVFLHPTFFVAPYFLFCLFFCIFLFSAMILFFTNRKMKAVILLQQKILQMAEGDLSVPLPALGNDEIGILSQELDHMRLALQESFQAAQQSHISNQDLITALSHDLRTPLTILKGYLEVIQLQSLPDTAKPYLERCFRKTEEIRQLTDRIFEYALVYEEAEIPSLSLLPYQVLLKCVNENTDFLRLTGFSVDISPPECLPCPGAPFFYGDEMLIKRILNNLFSNIIKYGDKKAPVKISCSLSERHLTLTLLNAACADTSGIESTQIGLKSARKMLELMTGNLETLVSGHHFKVTLQLPVCRK